MSHVVLLLLFRDDQIDLVILRLLAGVPPAQHFELNRCHDAYRPSVSLLAEGRANCVYELLESEYCLASGGLGDGLEGELFGDGEFPLHVGLLDTEPESLLSEGSSDLVVG